MIASVGIVQREPHVLQLGNASRQRRTMKLRYGKSAELLLDSSTIEVVAAYGTPPGEALDDTVAAVAASLLDPIDYPSLVEATVPGDRIALAIHRSVPQKRSVIAGSTEVTPRQ